MSTPKRELFRIIGRYDGDTFETMKQAGKKLTPKCIKNDIYFIKSFTHWFVTKAKHTYNFTTEQYILREDDRENVQGEKYRELFEIIEQYSQQGFLVWRNDITSQSIPGIIHYHISKFQNVDKDIIKLIQQKNPKKSMV